MGQRIPGERSARRSDLCGVADIVEYHQPAPVVLDDLPLNHIRAVASGAETAWSGAGTPG
jgi:hypothetical protein